VIELLGDEFARAGYEIENVVIDDAARRITVVADGDQSLVLDVVAELARTASDLLDKVDPASGTTGPGAGYELEVTSPGVDRPLTLERHYRRAQGRKVELTMSDGSQLAGRLGEIVDGTLQLVVREGKQPKFTVRELPLDGIANAVVQVEFSSPNQRELELAGKPEMGDGA
jgi:ribosome maturation factor RimP